MSAQFLQSIDVQIQSKRMLNHAFYQAWSRGELSKECLQEYAKDYYHHVKAFPQYLSALHSHTDSAHTRRVLLQNLIEEEAGSPNHPDLWRNFALSLGVSEEELENHDASKEMRALIATFKNICSDLSVEEGIGALYAYESQIPEVSGSKIVGLKEHYGMHNAQDWDYFSVHIDADKEHAAQERSLLGGYLNTDNIEKVNLSVDRVLDALGNFLSGLCQRYDVSEKCLCD